MPQLPLVFIYHDPLQALQIAAELGSGSPSILLLLRKWTPQVFFIAWPAEWKTSMVNLDLRLVRCLKKMKKKKMKQTFITPPEN